MYNIKKLRGKKGMSQSELANALGVTRAYVIVIEKDETKKLTPKMEKKVCDFFGLTLCELYGLDNLKHFPKTKQELSNLIELLQGEYDKWDS